MRPIDLKYSFTRIISRVMWLVALAVVCAACSKTPENVLGKEDMARLMADMHMGEAVIDYNYSAYPGDSARKALKQSIFIAHGVDQQTVDTSLVWYGNHIEDYIKVYERTIEIIQERQRDLAMEASSQIAISGDSVTIWNGPGHIVVSERMPSRIVTFDFTPDSTWQNGDIFMLRYVPVQQNGPVTSRLLVDYDNGTTGYVDDITTQSGATVQRIQVDSTLTPLRVYGYMQMPEAMSSACEIDSVAVVRMRHYMLPNTYISQKRFNNGIKQERKSVLGLESRSDMMMDEGDRMAAPSSGDAGHHSRPRTEPKHMQRAARNADELPQSSANREQTEHRRGAAEHRATPESRRQAAGRRQQAVPMQRQQRRAVEKR